MRANNYLSARPYPIIQQYNQFVNCLFVKNDIFFRIIYNLLLFLGMYKGRTNKIDKIDNNKSAQILMILSNFVKKEARIDVSSKGQFYLPPEKTETAD